MKEIPTVSRWEVIKNRKRILKNPLPFHHENFEKFGDSFRVMVGPPSGVIFTRDPEIIRHILQKSHRKYQKSQLQTEDLAKYIGKGLLTSNGEHWRVHRRMVQPAFHKKKLEALVGTMEKAIDEELTRLPEDKTIDVFPYMSDLAFQVVAQSLFSRADIRNRMKQLQQITEINQKMLIREMRQPYLNWWFKLSGKIKHHINLSKVGRELVNQIIEERIESGERQDDLLDMLLAARYEDGTAMSRQQLLDEVLILFTAGHETTANALSFTLFFLAKDQKLQEGILEEVGHIEAREGNRLEQFRQMKFTMHCIEESLRYFPPAYVIDREAIEEDEIGPLKLSRGNLVLMSVYELHRHREFWKEPEKYNPLRFAELSPKEYANYYYPFGAGPRMCIGNNFAIYEMILTLAKIISKYRISTELDQVEINPLISLKPLIVPLEFTPR